MRSVRELPLKLRASAASIPLAVLWIGGLWSSVNSTVTLHNDSPSYIANGSEVAFGNISVWGESLRPWPVTLLFSIPPDPSVGVALQVLMSLCAWTYFIISWTRGMCFASRFVSSALLTALALSPAVWQWNATVLSESLTLSLVLLGLAYAKTSLVDSQRQFLVAYLAISCLGLATVIRFQLAILLLAVGLFLVFRLRSQDGQSKRRIWGYSLILILMVVYAGGVNVAITNYWGQLPSGTDRNTVSYYYLTATASANDEVTSRLHAALPEEAPLCLKSDRASFGANEDPYGYQSRQIEDCPQGVEWLNANFTTWYATFLLKNPRYVYDVFTTYVPAAMNFAPYSSVSSVVPAPVAELWTSEQRESWGWSHKYSPFLGWLAAGLVSAVLALSRRHGIVAVSFLTVVYLSLLAALMVTFLVLNAEILRIGIFISVPLVATSIVLLATALSQRALAVDTEGRRVKETLRRSSD